MDDLISRQAALDAIDKNRQDLLSLGMDGAEHVLVHYGRRVIEELPTTEKVGKWKRYNTYRGDDTSGYVDPDWRCSECGKRANINECFMYDLTDFCPNCGARMEGEEE